MLWTRPLIRSLTDPLPRNIRKAGETNCWLTAPAGRICPLISNRPRWAWRQAHTRASASTSRRTLAGRPAAGVRAGCRAAPEPADVGALCAAGLPEPGAPWAAGGEADAGFGAKTTAKLIFVCGNTNSTSAAAVTIATRTSITGTHARRPKRLLVQPRLGQSPRRRA